MSVLHIHLPRKPKTSSAMSANDLTPQNVLAVASRGTARNNCSFRQRVGLSDQRRHSRTRPLPAPFPPPRLLHTLLMVSLSTPASSGHHGRNRLRQMPQEPFGRDREQALLTDHISSSSSSAAEDLHSSPWRKIHFYPNTADSQRLTPPHTPTYGMLTLFFFFPISSPFFF